MRKLSGIIGLVGAFAYGGIASAHGIVGERFFPPTITTDDPFAADELAILILSLHKNPGDSNSPETRVIGAGFEFDKLIVPKLAIGISETYLLQKPNGGATAQGFDNISLGIKYEVWRNDRHEAILAVGLGVDLGGTGSRRIGRDSFTTFTPVVYFGKGFGDLPKPSGRLSRWR